MLQLLTLAALAVLPFSLAAPTKNNILRRQSGFLSQSDMNVVELALFLEHLEYNLYTGGYENFTDAEYSQYGFPAGFRDGIGLTAQQEAIHAATLTQVLESNGVTPVPNCTYNFPYSNPKVGILQTIYTFPLVSSKSIMSIAHTLLIYQTGIHRTGQYDHNGGNRCIFRGSTRPHGQQDALDRSRIHLSRRSSPRLIPTCRSSRITFSNSLWHLVDFSLGLQSSSYVHRKLSDVFAPDWASTATGCRPTCASWSC